MLAGVRWRHREAWMGVTVNDGLRLASLAGMPAVPHQVEVDMTSANTEYQVELLRGDRNLVVRLRSSTNAWRYSFTPGVVAGGGGMRMDAGESLSLAGPFDEATLCLASSVASNTADVLREVPPDLSLSDE